MAQVAPQLGPQRQGVRTARVTVRVDRRTDRSDAREPPGQQRVEDAFAGQRVDQRHRVAGQQHPAASLAGPRGRQREVVADQTLGLDPRQQLQQTAVQLSLAAPAGSAQRGQQHPEADVRAAVSRGERPGVGGPVLPGHDDHLLGLAGRRGSVATDGDGQRGGRLASQAELAADDTVCSVGPDDDPGPDLTVENNLVVPHLEPAYGALRQHRPLPHGRCDQAGVEQRAWHDEVGAPKPAGDHPPVRGLQPEPVDRNPIGKHVRGAQPGQLVERLRGDAVATRLVARKIVPVQKQHLRVRASPQSGQCGGAPGRACADNDKVPEPVRVGDRHDDRMQVMSEICTTKPRVLSGIRPTGVGFQLGNYLGAVHHWAGMQDEAECFFFLADLHALIDVPDPALLRARTRESAAELVAMGVDPMRSAVFAQSHVREHAELGWVLGCLTGFGEAGRMTQFKDKGGGSVGLFTYPVLQAADILMYQADAVPIGADQRQHLELTRDLAQRFNSRYGQTFTVPGPYVGKEGERIKDLQDPTRKMSKSIGGTGTLWVLDEPKVVTKKVKSAVTDTGREVVFDVADKPGISNLLTILSVASGVTVAELERDFMGQGYGDFKAAVAEAVVALFEPVRTRYAELVADPAELDRLLAQGAARAREVAVATMALVRDRVGLLAPVQP